MIIIFLLVYSGNLAGETDSGATQRRVGKLHYRGRVRWWRHVVTNSEHVINIVIKHQRAPPPEPHSCTFIRHDITIISELFQHMRNVE